MKNDGFLYVCDDPGAVAVISQLSLGTASLDSGGKNQLSQFIAPAEHSILPGKARVLTGRLWRRIRTGSPPAPIAVGR